MDAAAGEERRVRISKLDAEVQELQESQRRVLEKLSMSRRPFATLKYFGLAVAKNAVETTYYLRSHHLVLYGLSLLVLGGALLLSFDGPHHECIQELLRYLRFAAWWICLGIASSIGLGSGLHTFLLYLGPHIAAFTLKATQCGRVDIKQAAYDTAQWARESSWTTKDCSQIGPPLFEHFPSEDGGYKVPMLMLLRQIQFEAMLWGLGTALGELPPYFVSRAARLSGEKLKELEELDEGSPTARRSLFDRLQRFVLRHGGNVTWSTVLIFASVPNPLFDLAGITCGHFLVPFWKFFSATLIGKAIIKTHIQTLFIILVFNAAQVERFEHALRWALKHVPVYGHSTLAKVLSVLDNARDKFGNAPDSSPIVKKKGVRLSLSSAWNTFVMVMLAGFVSSIVTSTARSYLIEKHKLEVKALVSRQKGGQQSGHSSTLGKKEL